MKTLEPPDTHYLSAAQGWIELGNHREATAELEGITASLQSHPDVLQVRWHICAKAEQWEACFAIGTSLVELIPKHSAGWRHRSVALHRLNSTQAAYDALHPALEKFPEDWPIAYDMACYACRLERLEEAQALLTRAFKLGDEKMIRQHALEDPDLEKIWLVL